MNYVAHTRAAHEHLSRQPQARPHHVSLYWTLFFEWNAARFAAGLDLDHPATMQAARIGSRQTYRTALYDLDAWGLLAYQPSRSRHERSRCFLTDLSSPEVAPINPGTGTTSGPDKTGLPGPEVGQALRPEVAPVNGLSGPEVVQASLYGKTKDLNSVVVNGSGGGPKKKGGQVFSGEGHSQVEVLNDLPLAQPQGSAANDADPPPTPAPEKKVAPKKSPPGRAAPASRRGRPTHLEVPFAESELAAYEDFAAAFAGTNYALADLRFYHEKVRVWRDRKTGEPPCRRDWKATAAQFMLNDAHDNRLKLAPVRPADPG